MSEGLNNQCISKSVGESVNERINEQMTVKHRAVKGEWTAGVCMDAGLGPAVVDSHVDAGVGREATLPAAPGGPAVPHLCPPDPTVAIGKGSLSYGDSGVYPSPAGSRCMRGTVHCPCLDSGVRSS